MKAKIIFLGNQEMFRAIDLIIFEQIVAVLEK
jgi:hypothetical protein